MMMVVHSNDGGINICAIAFGLLFAPLLLLLTTCCVDSTAADTTSGNSNRTRGMISAETFNYQFDDPLQRVICTRGPGPQNPRYNADFCKKDVFDKLGHLNFFIIGDMGGSSVWMPVAPYTTHAQRSVAAAMAQLARGQRDKKEMQPQFVINLGDNFYLNGVKDENDERFQKTFEDVYEEKTLNVPWFPIPGNHDYHGNVDAQIRYTNRSHRWTFAAKNGDETWYKIHYEFGQKVVNKPVQIEFIMIDTIMLCGESEDVRGDSYLHWIFHDSHTNPKKPPPGREAFATAQWEWLGKQLAEAKAKNVDYLFVAGHYPIYSVGKHGSFIDCLKPLDEMMRANGVTAYLSGHDHNLQHLRVFEGDGARQTQMDYVISGAGAATDRSQEHWDDFKKISGAQVLLQYPAEHWWWKGDEYFSWSTGGFVHAQATPDKLVLSFYSGQGSVCLGNAPLIGQWLSSFGGPLNINCQKEVHSTVLCPRNNAKACREEKVQEQGKTGLFFNGKNWWCLWLC